MRHELPREFAFESILPPQSIQRSAKIKSIGLAAVRKNFSPEFINRIDSLVTFQTLGSEALLQILDQQIGELQAQMQQRMGERTFYLDFPARARRFLLEQRTSSEYGARELKRTLQRHIQTLASMVTAGEV